MFETNPKIIQGGMGVAVSNWRLARAVSRTGQLGVVAGTGLDHVLVRRLQDGDPGGHMKFGLDHFPFRKLAERIWKTYFKPDGRRQGEPYIRLPMSGRENPKELQELNIAGNFVEVFLARFGHSNPVGINFLEKVQIPHLPSLYGAMLAGVSYVLMGAGIPLKIPGALDALSQNEPATYPLHITGAQEHDDTAIRFDPNAFTEGEPPTLTRPKFFAIIASNTLAETMLRKANGRVDGFVIEGPTAGGHNAPPRGKATHNAFGEPIYGERDVVDLDKIRDLGLPFWLAGGYGSPEKLTEALDRGAAGVQVGTAFAYCQESGILEEIRHEILSEVAIGKARVLTDSQASPTNFPFKVVQLQGSLSEQEVYEERPRICDLGLLREAYRKEDGTIGYRCAGEPERVYLQKGGKLENTVGRKCLCNALLANVGLAQVRNKTYLEKALISSGDDLTHLTRFLPKIGLSFTAADVVNTILSGISSPATAFA